VVKQHAVSTSPVPPVVAEPVRSEPDAPANVTVRSVRLQPDQRLARISVSDGSPFPEVLISDDERRAFALLLTTIEQGRFPPVPAVDAAEQARPIEPPALEIPDLVIEPLPQIAALE
jgi:hypothetical protein